MISATFKTTILFLLLSWNNQILVQAKLGEGTLVQLRGEQQQELAPLNRQLTQLQDFGGNPVSHYPLGLCQGDCDTDSECQTGLICYQRNSGDPVPGCTGDLNSRTDFCIYPTGTSHPPVPSPTPAPHSPTPQKQPLQDFGTNSARHYPLGLCQGECQNDGQCANGLVCFLRNAGEPVPGCYGNLSTATDYCVYPTTSPGSPTQAPTRGPPTPQPLPLVSYGSDPPSAVMPLKECEGDCDQDSDCASGLICLQRDPGEAVPGCTGRLNDPHDYCVRVTPTSAPKSHFKLKMYWQQGYVWQEQTFERKWCIHCRNGYCKAGINLYVSACYSVNQYFDFVNVTTTHDINMIRVSGSHLCLQRFDFDVLLEKCNSTNIQQHWISNTGAFSSYRFELTPLTLDTYCLTQDHHPKEDELLFLEPCAQASYDTTSYWVRYG